MSKTTPYLMPAALAFLSSRAVYAEDHYYTHVGAGTIIQNEITVHTSVNSTYFSLLGNSFGYGGIQQSSASNKRNWIFSFWDQNKEKTLLLAYAPDLTPQRIGRSATTWTSKEPDSNFSSIAHGRKRRSCAAPTDLRSMPTRVIFSSARTDRCGGVRAG